MRTKNPFLRLNRTPITMKNIIKSLNLFLYSFLDGQNQSDDSEVYDLSPFVVNSDDDIGYVATSTLGGTRFKTNLFETPASISVMTKELLNDINAENLEEYLTYATSSDRDFGLDPTGLNNAWQDSGRRIKIRSFGNVQVTRDYFAFGVISADRFNVERIDFQRGPNAILYGLGSPGGVVNSSSKRARLNSSMGSVSSTIGSFSKMRVEGDYNVPLVEDKFAVRINGLWEDSESWQKPTETDQEAVALAATWRPYDKTEVRFGYEHNDRFWITANPYPPGDFGGSEWYLAGAPLVGDPLLPQDNLYPDLLQPAVQQNVSWAPQLRNQPFRLSTLGVDMRPDLEGNQRWGHWRTIAGPNAYPNARPTDLDLVKLLGQDNNYFGPGHTRDDYYTVWSAFLTQEISDFFFELAYSNFRWSSISFNPISWNSGIYGDPNPVLPGAYFADGDSNVAGGQSPGTLLPDIGAPNPQAGNLYIEGWGAGRNFEEWSDYYRITVSRELDLTDRSEWLGHHTFAGLWQLDEELTNTAPFSEYNTTPNNNDRIRFAQNGILRRTYLDLSPGGAKWFANPRENPVPTDTGVTAEFIHRGVWADVLNETEAVMGVLQSRFWDDRLIFTTGYREDKLTTNRATQGGEDFPGSINFLRLKPHTIFEKDREDVFKGDTTTFGGFFSVLPWLGLTFNTSESIQPQTQTDIYGDPIGTRSGEGDDYGLRFKLLDDKVYFSATYWESADANQRISGTARIQWSPVHRAFNQVFDASVDAGVPLPAKLESRGLQQFDASFWDVSDFVGSGLEYELTGNITPQWSISLNYSSNDMEVGSNYAPGFHAFIVDNQSLYQGNQNVLLEAPIVNVRNFIIERDNSPGRDFTAEPATFNDVWEFGNQVLAQVRQLSRPFS